ncbi:ribosome biogenesis GTPase Der [Candidatus Uhrbacteria bacterium]|nr:ribosome biogenesis GTPase Der [Candidatus Uhrbacteria bacterium]
MQQEIPKVALVGRTNVGKSTLFNKLIEEQRSLVSDVAGTTRDRFEADCIWRGKVIRLIDTGGLDVDPSLEIERGVIEQTDLAISDADVVLFLVDVTVGPTTDDYAIAKKLFEAKKPVIVVGNKADTPALRMSAEGVTWRSWPIAKPFPVSAARGTGAGDLLDEVYAELSRIGKEPADVSTVLPMRIAVFGEPNAGKSTLLNALLGEKRFLASSIAHTTRQPNEVAAHIGGRDYLFFDTAGVRRQARRNESGTMLEKYGVQQTIEMLKRVNVVLFVIDINQKITAQDKHLAGLIAEHGASVVLIANKWDLIPDKDTNTINKYDEYIRAHLPQIGFAPIVFISALTGKRVQDTLEVIDRVFASRFTELDDAEAKQFISRAIARHKPSKHKGTWHPNIIGFEQYATNPPRFRLTINAPREDALAESYVKFLERQMRMQFDFEGTPIKINVSAVQRKHGEARTPQKKKK